MIVMLARILGEKSLSIDAILEAYQQRGLGKRPNQKLIVSGCMSQRFVASPLRTAS